MGVIYTTLRHYVTFIQAKNCLQLISDPCQSFCTLSHILRIVRLDISFNVSPLVQMNQVFVFSKCLTCCLYNEYLWKSNISLNTPYQKLYLY